MLKIRLTTQFKKDYKKIKKRGYNTKLLKKVVDDLSQERKLDIQYHDHSLGGEYKGFRECHILPDWLLIYTIEKSDLILILTRTGSHTDLFNI